MSRKTSPPGETREVRVFQGAELRVEQGEDGKPRITGYAAVFNKMSVDLGGFREIILPGAFRNHLEMGADVRALVEHDPAQIIGRTKSGTLRLREDDIGLRVLITPPDTQAGRDVVTSIQRGDRDGMSFGFRTVADNWRTENEESIREVREAMLFDVSPVTFPAYPDTVVGLRSLEEWRSKWEASARERELNLAALG